MRARLPLAALLVGMVTALALTLAGCGGDTTSASDPPTDSGSASTDTPSTSAPTSGSTAPTSPTSSGSDTAAAAVYFVGTTPQGPRLFREFWSVPASDDLDQALAVLTGTPHDPDYRSLLPQGSMTEMSHDEALMIALPDASWGRRPDGMSAAEARLAVQQVVYTAQAALQQRIPLQFFVDDKPVDLFGVPTPKETQGYQAAKPLSVLGLVNVTTPDEGAQVTGGQLTASGVASSFEGTVGWQILDSGGAKVLEGSAQAEGWIHKLYPWQTDVDVSSLAPGTYTFVAMTDDPTGGEGPGPTQDTKTFTIG